ncbi:MAG: glycosyltransferase [bacterium]
MISVIIPVYNAEEFLPSLFESIKIQNLDKNLFEVLFVDNSSIDSSHMIIQEFIENNKEYQLKYFHYSKKASSYAARNYGVKRAVGEILAFTDSDCIPENDWLENIYNELKDNTDIIISGKVELFLDDKENIWENFDKTVHMRNDIRVQKNQVATANMAVRKDIFLELGFFSEVKSGGDFAWAENAVQLNKEIVYKENITVLHPSRKEFTEIEKKMKRLAFGEGQLYKEKDRGLVRGILKGVLRLIYLPKHIYISRNMYSNVGLAGVTKFNILYFYLKLEQLFSFVKGYSAADE